jgi:hypothetical protein
MSLIRGRFQKELIRGSVTIPGLYLLTARLYHWVILGSIVHAKMLALLNRTFITEEDARAIGVD